MTHCKYLRTMNAMTYMYNLQRQAILEKYFSSSVDVKLSAIYRSINIASKIQIWLQTTRLLIYLQLSTFKLKFLVLIQLIEIFITKFNISLQAQQ